MAYPALITFASEADCRAHFERVYCQGPIATFDGIMVRFRKNNFDHCFFESTGRNGVKDQFSRPRSERVDWIKAALEDTSSELYEGWDSSKKRYDRSRRATIVMGNYVVIIAFTGIGTADFVTAYVADSPARPGRLSTIDKIRSGPRW